MKKNNGKILALLLIITFIGYSFVGTNSTYASTPFTHENTKIQGQTTDCEENSGNCEEEHAEECESCITNNHCHHDYLATPFLKITFIENKKSLFLKNLKKYKNLNFPPESPPS